MNRRDDPSSALQTDVPLRGREADLRQTEQQLQFALHAGRMGSWEFDIAAQRFKTSDYCRVVFGLAPDYPFDRLEDLQALIHPDDREKRQAAVQRALATGEEMEVEYRTLRPDGSIGWVLARGRGLYEDGVAVGMAGISLDITARRLAEERQELMNQELNHRVKNTLATVQSLAMQTYGGGEVGPETGPAFLERLRALARVHDLLSEAAWEGASLREVVNRTLEPYAEGAARFAASGPGVRLAPNAAVTLNMGFHELATNAVKYGALSTPAGRVDIDWRMDGDAVALDWRESGGPAVEPPRRRGFGARLIERGLAHELGGEARLSFPPEGLHCHIRLPLSAKLSLAPG